MAKVVARSWVMKECKEWALRHNLLPDKGTRAPPSLGKLCAATRSGQQKLPGGLEGLLLVLVTQMAEKSSFLSLGHT